MALKHRERHQQFEREEQGRQSKRKRDKREASASGRTTRGGPADYDADHEERSAGRDYCLRRHLDGSE